MGKRKKTSRPKSAAAGKPLRPIGCFPNILYDCIGFHHSDTDKYSLNHAAGAVYDYLIEKCEESFPGILYVNTPLARGPNRVWTFGSDAMFDIASSAWRCGLHTLPKVLDALCLPEQAEHIVVRLSFDDSDVASHKPRPDITTAFPARWLDISFPKQPKPRGSYGKGRQVFPQSLLEIDLRKHFAIHDTIFASSAALLDGLIPIIHPMCEVFDLPTTIVTFRSLCGAILELRRYAEHQTDADHSAMLLMPVADGTQSFSFGLTLFSGEPIEENVVKSYAKNLLDAKRDLDAVLHKCARPKPEVIKQERALSQLNDVAFAQDQLQNPLVDSKIVSAVVAAAFPSNEKIPQVAVASVERFLGRCLAFTDIREEGRDVEFGLLLGDPFALRYWPGMHPLPITVPAITTSTVEQDKTMLWKCVDIDLLTKKLEYLANPHERCVVFPYGASYRSKNTRSQNTNAPAYSLDISDFTEGVVSWPEAGLWSSNAGIYAYLSRQHQSVVAALVGPGSLIRVFCRGNLVAYYHGKGWKYRDDVSNRLAAALHCKRERLGLLSEVVRVAEQLSPQFNSSRHGGLVAYAPDVTAKIVNETVDLEPLHSGESMRIDGDKKNWITESELLVGSATSGYTLSMRVARLVLRTAQIDGAILLEGERATVKNFGQRITFKKGKGAADSGGTKHTTAMQWAQTMGPGAFAIAVSSNGGGTVYHHPGSRNSGQGKKTVPVEEPLFMGLAPANYET